MPSIQETIDWYDAQAETVAERYEAVDPEKLLGWCSPLLPTAPGLVIDIGAGTGRDAAWFASRGFEVIAVEPAARMRKQGQIRHDMPAIKWKDDRLPTLSGTLALGLAADVVHIGAVWMHLSEHDQLRALRKVISLTRSGGLILLTVRREPFDDGREFHATSVFAIESLARNYGLIVAHVEHTRDAQRENVTWDCVALRLPDDGTDALPTLRHVILNDSKTSSYKLGLLRSICQAAEKFAGLASDAGDDHVNVPLGLVAMIWLRLYVPLINKNLPQSVINVNGGVRLAFFNEAVESLVRGDIPIINLRVGAIFSEAESAAVHSALLLTAQTILKNPATYTTYPKGGPIFPFHRGVGARVPKNRTIDGAYLTSFGSLLVPRDIWRAMQRFGSWIEPSIVAEWITLMKGYAERLGRALDYADLATATIWVDQERDVGLATKLALELLAKDTLYCVWSGRKLLDKQALNIDHGLPWSAWPCGDLWNLLPSEQRLNRDLKRHRIPTDRLLIERRGLILDWWRNAYAQTEVTRQLFFAEAKVSLPGLSGNSDDIDLEDVFAAMRFQRLRLWRDQQIPEWDGR